MPTLGPRVAEVAQALGTPLMPWQRHVADVALEVDPGTGLLSRREVVLTVPRQQGKTVLLLALLVHRALGWPVPQRTAYACQARIDARSKLLDEQVPAIQSSPFGRLARPRRAIGAEAILWRNGSMHQITATTDTAGHGATLDLGMIDEAFAQTDDRLEQAYQPAMLTRPDAQLWVVSTAGTAESAYLRQKVDAGRARVESGESGGAAYVEWSADPDADPEDPATWRACMPALGRTCTEETISAVLATALERPGGLDAFRRAYLNLWPESDRRSSAYDMDAWRSASGQAAPGDGLVLALDLRWDGAWGAIAAAGDGPGGGVDVELVDHRQGATWLVPRALELAQRWGARVALAPGSAAGRLLPALKAGGVEPLLLSGPDLVRCCSFMEDLLAAGRVRHRGQPPLDAAMGGARRKVRSDGSWVLDPADPATDLSPAWATVMAAYAWQMEPASVPVEPEAWVL